MVGLAGGGGYPSVETQVARGGGTATATAAISGMDVWEAVSKGVPSPRSDLLYNYDQVVGCGALRRGRYKLVHHGGCGADRASQFHSSPFYLFHTSAMYETRLKLYFDSDK